MEDIQQAERFINLSKDPVFNELVEQVKLDQVSIFTNPKGSTEQREEAHSMIRALSRLLGRITSANNTVETARRRGQDANGH